MKNHYMKIQNRFIPKIVDGIKKHEYRLCEDKWRQVKIGDTLVLRDNQDKKNYIRVEVKNIEKFNSWNTALNKYWKDDFDGVFDTYEECLENCCNFYDIKEVDEKGIIVFEIRPIIVDYLKARTLLDTNIIIKRESGSNVSVEVSRLYKWLNNIGIKMYVHPSTINEIAKYKDKKIVDVMLKKLKSYNELKIFMQKDDEFFQEVLSKFRDNENDRVDNALIKEVYIENVDILVTDDKTILKKAEELCIRDKVLSSSELLTVYEKLLPDKIEYKMLSVKTKLFEEIDVNDSFFDSLRANYGGKEFNTWFKTKIGDKAYVFYEDELLKGFLYFKIENENENYSDIKPGFSPAKRIKIGTFKVDKKGYRLGERFLKLVFDNAIILGVEEIYITFFDGADEDITKLRELLETWGFVYHGSKKDSESVFVKKINYTSYNPNRDPKFNYPVKSDNPQYFILPINPEYHTNLFPDFILNIEDSHLFEENFPHRNAIEKIYLTGAKYAHPKPGDLIMIYRRGERWPKKYSSVVTGVAILQEFVKPRNLEECIKICGNRSIFGKDEIKEIYGKYNIVVKLLDFVIFKHKVILEKLCENGIVDENSGPRPFHPLTKEQFMLIYNLGMEDK